MKDDAALTTGAMLLGSGVAGYAVGRFVIQRWLAGPAATATAARAPSASASSQPTAQARLPTAPTRPRPAPRPAREPAAGPVTSPAQVDAMMPSSDDAGTATFPVADRDEDDGAASRRPSRRFDRVFDMYRESIPIEFLRALAKRESNLNSEERTGPAWGLMQIVEVVRKDYNQAHGTRYTRRDLLDPAINVAIACWLLRFIIAQYAKHQDDVPNLRADWNNPRFVALLVAGWNAGFSTSGGVLKVVRYLKARGTTDITIDLVFQHARAAGAVRHLSNAARLRWANSVVRLYEQERGASRTAQS